MTPPHIRKRQMRKRRIKAGLCVECGAKAMKESHYCGYHDALKDERLQVLHAQQAERRKAA